MTDIAQVSETQSNKSVTVNENFEAVSPAGAFGVKRELTVGLTFAYYGASQWVDGVLTTIADGTLALTGSVTNYIERTHAGVVSKNNSGFTAGLVPLYEATTSASAITALVDRRVTNTPFYGFISVALAGSPQAIILSAAQARAHIIELTGVLTGSWQVILPTIKSKWIVVNNCTGGQTVTVKTAAGTGVDVTQGKSTIIYGDGTNIARAVTEMVGGAIDNTTIGATTRSSIRCTTLDASGNIVLGDNASDTLQVTTNAMVVTAAGEVTFPLQPAFLARKSAQTDNVTGNGTVYAYVCNDEIHDQGADYNAGTGVYTAPVTGKHDFATQVYVTGIVGGTGGAAQIQTSNRTYRCGQRGNAATNADSQYGASVIAADMDSGDTAFPSVFQNGVGADTADIYGDSGATIYTWFSGKLSC